MSAGPMPDTPPPGGPAVPESDGDRLLALVYDELRGLAARYLRGERPDHSLRPTELVHEAYLRIAKRPHAPAEGREHFFTVAASAMRRILVDHARSRRAAKHGGGAPQIAFDDLRELSIARDDVLIALDEALVRLAPEEPDLNQVVELRFFGGLTVEETARVMGISPRTVERKWALARSWLHREITRP